MGEVGDQDGVGGSHELAQRGNVVEKIARGKVVDINAPGTLIYITQVENLSPILEEGVLSQAEARKKKKTGYSMRWKGHSDPKFVYVGKIRAGGEQEFKNVQDFAIHILHPNEADQTAVLILDPSVEDNSETTEWESERLVLGRIPPDKVVGIAVGGTRRPFMMDYVPQRESIVDLHSDGKLVRQLLGFARQDVRRISRKNPDRAVPIYDMTGKLLWPVG